MVREGHEQKTSGNSAARGNKLGTVRHWFHLYVSLHDVSSLILSRCTVPVRFYCPGFVGTRY